MRGVQFDFDFRHFTLYYDHHKRNASTIHEWIGRGTTTCDHGRFLLERVPNPRVCALELELGKATTPVGISRKQKRAYDI